MWEHASLDPGAPAVAGGRKPPPNPRRIRNKGWGQQMTEGTDLVWYQVQGSGLFLLKSMGSHQGHWEGEEARSCVLPGVPTVSVWRMGWGKGEMADCKCTGGSPKVMTPVGRGQELSCGERASFFPIGISFASLLDCSAMLDCTCLNNASEPVSVYTPCLRLESKLPWERNHFWQIHPLVLSWVLDTVMSYLSALNK